MKTEIDPDDRLSLAGELPRVVFIDRRAGGSPGVRERTGDVLVARELTDVLLGRDDGHQLDAAFGGLADLDELHPLRRGGGKPAEVIGNPLVSGQLVIGAGFETDNRLRR